MDNATPSAKTIGLMSVEQSLLPLQWREPSVTLKPLNESFPADKPIRLGVLFGACRLGQARLNHGNFFRCSRLGDDFAGYLGQSATHCLNRAQV